MIAQDSGRAVNVQKERNGAKVMAKSASDSIRQCHDGMGAFLPRHDICKTQGHDTRKTEGHDTEQCQESALALVSS